MPGRRHTWSVPMPDDDATKRVAPPTKANVSEPKKPVKILDHLGRQVERKINPIGFTR